MLEKLKYFVAKIIFRRKFTKSLDELLPYNEFFSKSLDFFLLLPIKESDFHECQDILKYLKIHKKFVTIFIPEYKLNLFQNPKEYKFVTYQPDEITKFDLPSKNLLEKIIKKNYDCLIDLTRTVNLFNAAVSNSVNAKYRIGFVKGEEYSIYNFQVAQNEINAEISYKNLLNSLRMF